MSAEVAAATLMLHCEMPLTHEHFADLDQAHFRDLGNLFHLTQVGLVMRLLEGLAKRHGPVSKAQRLLSGFQIIFDPDMFTLKRSQTVQERMNYLSDLATKAFALMGMTESHSPDDPLYYSRVNRWSCEWLEILDDDPAVASSIAKRYGLVLAASLLDQIGHLQRVLTNALEGG